jgi:hypothetical protein
VRSVATAVEGKAPPEMAVTTKTRCSICGAEVYRDRFGKVLMHTTAASGGTRPASYRMFDPGARYTPAKVCEGSDRGARP